MIYLASASPRRRALLAQIGIDFECLDVSVDEHPQPGEGSMDFVRRLARAKALAGRARMLKTGLSPRPVLGADTAVVIDGDILGKPRDRADGLAMLKRLSGRAHEVLTAICLIDGRLERGAASTSRVWLSRLPEEALVAYWETGEPRDKAGAYAIQGRAARFISRLEGSYSGVVGLPLYELSQLLSTIGT